MANIVFDFLHNYETGERREPEPATAYQYDEGHVLEAVLPEVITSAEIHYWIRGMEEADAYTPTSITPNADGSCTVLGNIPNKYFETNGELRIYIVVTDGTASITTYEGKLHIAQRAMPDDYVDDDPENEATRILTEAQAAATTATQQAQAASASAGQAQQSAQTLSQSVEQIETNTADITQLKEDKADTDSVYVTDTASGSIASFPDGADGVPVKSLKVAIEPVQSGSGDPSPDNVRPISGHTQAVVTRCGVNVWDEEWKVIGDHIGSKNPIPCLPNTAYFMNSLQQPSNGLRFWTSDMVQTGSTRWNAGLFTTPSDCHFMTFEMTSAYGTTYNHDISINYPATDTKYHEGHVQTVTIDFGDTIYGGTLDVGTGVLTVDRAIWDFNASVNAGEYGMPFSAFLPNNVKMTTSSTVLSGTICNQLMEVTQASSWGINGTFSRIANSTRMYFKINDDVTTIESLNEYLALHPLQFAYPIANPFTAQLTANEISTLLGQNNIWSDAGNVDVTYRADTKLYIEKLTAPTEDDMVADHAISANSFFMVGNTLYRATTAIASGATITVGTNATKLSLSDALNALS